MYRHAIQYRGATPSVMQREMNRIVRESYVETGQYVHEKLIPSRFTYYVIAALGGTERKRAYQAKKRKKFGHIRPNVFTGESEQRSKIQDVSAIATRNKARAEIRLHTPRLNYKNPKSNVHPADEIRRISPREVPGIERQLSRSMIGRFKNLQNNEDLKV